MANAFFTVGQVLFEIPTGIVADIKGRRTSYLLGTLVLAAATLLYLGAWRIQAPFWAWAIASMLLGLGYTFFSGATEAWLVDSLAYARYKGELDGVFGKSQVLAGVAMLVGSVAGGAVAQATDLGVPYLLRGGFLLVTFVIAFFFMHDWGFKPEKSVNIGKDVRRLFVTSFDVGLRKPAVRWVMVAAPFISGVSLYVFYAMQPHLLNLYGDQNAYGIAGLAAAIIAAAQIVGGLTAPIMRKAFGLRTTAMLAGSFFSVACLVLLARTDNFWVAIALISAWGLIGAAETPIRQAYLNSLIPSKQRATVLSFDSLMGSAGGVVIQPVLGRVADVSSYPHSFFAGAIFQAVAIPLTWLARRENIRAESEPKGVKP
jgi:MFS family permease